MTNLQENSIQKIKEDFERVRRTFTNSIIETEVVEYYDFLSLTIINDLPNRTTLARTRLNFIIGKRGKIQYIDFKDNYKMKDYKRNIWSVVVAQSIR